MDEAHKKELEIRRLKHNEVKFQVTFEGHPNYSKTHLWFSFLFLIKENNFHKKNNLTPPDANSSVMNFLLKSDITASFLQYQHVLTQKTKVHACWCMLLRLDGKRCFDDHQMQPPN